MASFKTGTIDSKTSIGNQAYTGVGFQPKLIILWSAPMSTADGNTADLVFTFGAATSSTQRFTAGFYSQDGQGQSNDSRVFGNDAVFASVGPGTAVPLVADFVSMDADGFTLNWSIVEASAKKIHYIAVGGADVSAKVGSYDTGSAGNQSITGVGFQPSIVILNQALDNNANGVYDYFWHTLGAGISSSSRFSINNEGYDGQDTMRERSKQIGTKILETDDNGTIITSTDLVSLDADGFTVNHSTVIQQPRVGYIAIGGIQAKIGTVTQPTSNGSQGVTGVGFQPQLLMLASWGKASSTSTSGDIKYSFGSGTSSGDRRYAAAGTNHNIATSEADSRSITNKIIGTLSAGTPTLNSEADLTSMDSDGFTLDWTTTDATAREIYYIALSTTATPGSSSIAKRRMMMGIGV